MGNLQDTTATPVTPPKKIAHIGIAVNSIEDSLRFYIDSLGLELEGVEEVQSEGVKVAFIKIGETRFELLEPLHDESAIKKFLEKKGEGLHHIALEVDDIDARLQHLKVNNVPLINEEAKIGAHNSQIAFIHPKAASKVLYELCQSADGGEA